MPDQTLMDFFAGSRMTELAQSEAIKRGVTNPLPDALYQVGSSRPTTNKVEYWYVKGTRRTAQLVHQNSPSRAISLPGAQRKYATAVSMKHNFQLEPETLYAIKSDIPMIRENAKRYIVKQVADYRALFDNTRASLVASVFATGAIYADANGNVLPNSTGAIDPIDFGVATANKITKAGAGSTYNIGDWSSASTDIAKALRVIRSFNVKANGYQLDTIMYGSDVPGFLAANTTLQQYFARNPQVNEAISLKNEIPDGTLGYKWKPVYTSFYEDSTGTVQSWYPTNYLGFIPMVEENWYEVFEGGTLVPKGVATPGMSFDQMIQLCDIVNGTFSYSEMSLDPVACKVIVGDCYLPTLKVPGTFYFGTCS